jgi:hypothetical protein
MQKSPIRGGFMQLVCLQFMVVLLFMGLGARGHYNKRAWRVVDLGEPTLDKRVKPA